MAVKTRQTLFKIASFLSDIISHDFSLSKDFLVLKRICVQNSNSLHSVVQLLSITGHIDTRIFCKKVFQKLIYESKAISMCVCMCLPLNNDVDKSRSLQSIIRCFCFTAHAQSFFPNDVTSKSVPAQKILQNFW